MTQYNNALLKSMITPEASGAVYVDRQQQNLAFPNVVPAQLNIGDQFQIGVVPAGSVLIPWLCNLHFPAMDSNGSPTLAGSIGTANTPAALAAAAVFTAAKNVAGSSLLNPQQVIGDPEVDTPIYLTVTTAAATPAKTGLIWADLALRAWRDDTDSGNQTA